MAFAYNIKKPNPMKQHTFSLGSEEAEQILKPAVNFFLNSPLIKITDLEPFFGVGVYGIYLTPSAHTYYKKINANNPIYIGKAVPSGSRQGRSSNIGKQLYTRLSEHKRSISVTDIKQQEVSVRFVVMDGFATELIQPLESQLIKRSLPLWNSHIDGFGNHDPGSGRRNQQPSEWDTLHPGRAWANKLTGQPRDIQQIIKKI